jgi:hypothetical protein
MSSVSVPIIFSVMCLIMLSWINMFFSSICFFYGLSHCILECSVEVLKLQQQ